MDTDTNSIPEEDLRERALELLEFPQVMERLAGHTQTPLAREQALSLKPAYTHQDQVYFHLAESLAGSNEVTEAIPYFARILEEFEASEYADDAQFMIGFISEEYLEEYARARESYRLVIDRYPDSELAASARRLLPNVGKAPEEWVKFQEGTSSR